MGLEDKGETTYILQAPTNLTFSISFFRPYIGSNAPQSRGLINLGERDKSEGEEMVSKTGKSYKI